MPDRKGLCEGRIGVTRASNIPGKALDCDADPNVGAIPQETGEQNATIAPRKMAKTGKPAKKAEKAEKLVPKVEKGARKRTHNFFAVTPRYLSKSIAIEYDVDRPALHESHRDRYVLGHRPTCASFATVSHTRARALTDLCSTGAAVGGALGASIGAMYGTYEAIKYKVPGLYKIRYIGQTTVSSAAVFGLFLGAGSLLHCGRR